MFDFVTFSGDYHIPTSKVWANPNLRNKHSKIIKESWNDERKRKASERLLNKHPTAKKVKINDIVFNSIAQAARTIGVSDVTIKRRIESKVEGYEYI